MALMQPAERMTDIPFSGIREVFEEVSLLLKEGKEIINLSIGRPDFDTPTHIKEAAIQALNQGLVHYTSNYGSEGLREAIQNKLRVENKINVALNEIIVTIGANQAISLAMQALLDVGDEVLVPDPAWLHYHYCAQMVGGKAIRYPILETDNFSIDPEQLVRLITPKTKMVVVNTPHNPTGAVLDKQTLNRIAAIAIKYNLIVLSDEIYEKLLFNDAVHYSLASFPGMAERTLTVNGYSKAYSMTGWRVGYIVGPKHFIDALIRVHQYSVTCATTFAQKGAEVAYRSSQDSVRTMLTEFDRRRKLVVDAIHQIDRLSLVEPMGAFYAFINIKELEMNAAKAAQYFLKEAGVALVPGSVFGEYGEGYIRVAFSNSYENIERAMTKLAKTCQKM